MKQKILTLIIGILIGAVVTTGVFLVINKVSSNDKEAKSAPDGTSNFTPGERQNGEKSDREKPSGERPDGESKGKGKTKGTQNESSQSNESTENKSIEETTTSSDAT